jgi:hypothetical protein
VNGRRQPPGKHSDRPRQSTDTPVLARLLMAQLRLLATFA